jgi:putative ABC transport system substrate-binding protein
MERREFITLVGGAAVAWPHAARAQQSRKIPRIGVLWHAGNEEEEAPFLSAFRQGLRQIGYLEGQNIVLENRFAHEQSERFDALASEFVQLKVDVLVAVSTPAAVAAHRATTTIPVVFISVVDPVAAKLVDSLARPGANITGTSNMSADLGAKQLELFKETGVNLFRVALLNNPSNTVFFRAYNEQIQTAADSLGLSLKKLSKSVRRASWNESSP